jgi:hypothetical protein
MAANFVFQAMLALQLDFYTHTFGLTAAQGRNLFLVVGLGVACLNPVMGVIADRTSYEMGQIQAVAAVDGFAIRRHRRTDFHHAQPQPFRQNHLRVGHLHSSARDLHREQRAVCDRSPRS